VATHDVDEVLVGCGGFNQVTAADLIWAGATGNQPEEEQLSPPGPRMVELHKLSELLTMLSPKCTSFTAAWNEGDEFLIKKERSYWYSNPIGEYIDVAKALQLLGQYQRDILLVLGESQRFIKSWKKKYGSVVKK